MGGPNTLGGVDLGFIDDFLDEDERRKTNIAGVETKDFLKKRDIGGVPPGAGGVDINSILDSFLTGTPLPTERPPIAFEERQRLSEIEPTGVMARGGSETLAKQVQHKDQIAEDRREARRPTGIFTGFIDVISRGQFGSAALVDSLMDEGPILGLIHGTVRAFKEIVSPVDRLSYSDIIEKAAPEWAQANPTTAMALGLIGDIALDPTTYLTLGGGAGAKVATRAGVKILSKAGKRRYTHEIADLMAKEGLSQGLAVREAEKTIGKLLDNSAPELVESLTTKKIGFKDPFFVRAFTGAERGTVSLGVERAVVKRALSNIPGLERVKASAEAIRDGHTVETFNRLFRRNKDLPEEWKQGVTRILEEVSEAERRIATDLVKAGILGIKQRTRVGEAAVKLRRNLGYTVKADGAERITLAAHQIQDEVRVLQEMGNPVTPRVLEDIKQSAYKKHKLRDKEITLLSVMRDNLDNVREMDMEMGLLNSQVAEYWPRMWDIIKDSDELVNARKALRGMDPDFAKSRKFASFKEGIEAGYKPELNAFKLYTQRIMASKRAAAMHSLKSLKDELVKGVDSKAVSAIEADLRRVGSSNSIHLSVNGFDISQTFPARFAVKSIDFINGIFKPTATVLKPGFSVFQAVSNRTQRALVEGMAVEDIAEAIKRTVTFPLRAAATRATKALPQGEMADGIASIAKRTGVFDPTSRVDAAYLLSNLDNAEATSKMMLKTGSGMVYTGNEITQFAKELGVIQGTSAGGVKFSNTALKELRRQNRIANVAAKTGISEGFLDVAGSSLKYWQFPQRVEDFARMQGFVNNLRAGHAPGAAARLVNEALFDYMNGLTKFEQSFVKRLIPFYSFQRFSIPLIVKTAFNHPGRVANSAAVMKNFFNSWSKIRSGESLNPTERALTPGIILEQPSAFAGFERDTGKAIWNTFNNFTPIDVVNFLEPGEAGKEGISMARTVEKSILSTIGPAIKVPIEFLADKNFFTGKSISKAREWQQAFLGQVEGSRLIEAMDATIPDAAKKAMSWERGINGFTGKETIYVNPYMAHAAFSFVPALRTVIRAADGGKTPGEVFASLFMNVNTFKTDLKQQKAIEVRKNKRARQQLKRDLSIVRKEKRDSYNDALREYRVLRDDLLQERKRLNQFPVRGPGDFQ